MRETTERIEPSPGWSWARLGIETGEVFTNQDGETEQVFDFYVVPDKLHWIREVDGEPVVSADFAVQDGKVLCIGVRHHGSLERPVSTTAIRDVALDEVGRAAFVAQAMTEAPRRQPTQEETAAGNESAAFFDVTREPVERGEGKTIDRSLRGTRGRPPIPREELEQVARYYRAAERDPAKYVGEHMPLSPSQVTRRIQQARKAGLLPPTTQGKASR